MTQHDFKINLPGLLRMLGENIFRRAARVMRVVRPPDSDGNEPHEVHLAVVPGRFIPKLVAG